MQTKLRVLQISSPLTIYLASSRAFAASLFSFGLIGLLTSLLEFFFDLVLVKLIPWFAVIILNVKVVIASRKFRERRLQLLNKTEDARGNRMTN